MLYLHAFTQGILLGLTLSIMLGPAFFSLIQTSVSKGFRSGVYFAVGISLSDIFMVFVGWLGLSSLFEYPLVHRIFVIVGGSALSVLGIHTFRKKHVTRKAKEIEIRTPFQMRFIFKGFLSNIANPATWFFWLLPIGLVASYSNRRMQMLFLIGILATIFVMDVIKCMIASELKRFMTDNVITVFNKIVGVILILFAVYLFLSLYVEASFFQVFS